MPRPANPMLRLAGLCLLLVAFSVTCWLLDSSNIFTSPNQTLADLNASLRASSKELAKRWNNLLGHADANLIPNRTLNEPTAFYRMSDPVRGASWQTIMPTIEALNKQNDQRKNEPSYHNQLGILYAQIGDFGRAIQHLNQAVSLCRQELLSLAATTKQNNNLNLNVKKTNKKANAHITDCSAIYLQLNCAYINLARIYDKLGDHNQAISMLNELKNGIPFSGNSPASISTSRKIAPKARSNCLGSRTLTESEAVILARADALRYVGRFPEAVAEYLKLISLNPRLAVAHQRLGLAAVSDHNFALAINELQQAAQLDKSNPDTQNDLGLVYQQIGDYKSAQQSFMTAHKIDPRHLDAAINLANSLAASGNYKSGIAIMSQATAYYPASAIAHNNLATLLARINKPTQAAKEFAKAINLKPTLASAHYGLGIALLKLKSYQPAEKSFMLP